MGVCNEDQREAIAFLGKRETYGVVATAVERIDTHSAMVFLAADRAYKLKRAVRFSYLDFSTLERRGALCRAELALNKRTAPEIYLEVRSITREADGSYAFDGAGIVLDYVVVMRRFDQNSLFDRLASRGALDDALVTQLSAEVARFHAAAEKTPGHSGRASLEVEISGNDANLRLAPPDILASDVCRALVHRWRAELQRYAALLDRRDEGGKVRRCHGDLHLRNICLWHGRPTLFDCIEFSEHLACIDVLYDLAFLLMDLLRRRLGAFANLLFNAYLDLNDESDGVGALPLMMSLRAGIRTHTGLAAAHAQPRPEDRKIIIDEAREYLSLADHLLHDQVPRLIAIGA
ncbi:MAG: phosphotransferase [Candidatus Eremiobacteraeota bacterium]|nr:phosphotransferase [Candidatus Eremiobacteraeota bacterium]